MYSSLGLLKNSKHSGKIVGTHQKIDEIAYYSIYRRLKKVDFFPNLKEILYFEGARGPDGLKRKSPGVDEPIHFIVPKNDDGELFELIENHHYNLKIALKTENIVRAAFEAAWLAHAITDGLTPAHHFPLKEKTEELMSSKDFVKIFGEPIKGIMRGKNAKEALKNNWAYWGKGGYMSKHIAFEYGVALIATPAKTRTIAPKILSSDLENLNLHAIFYSALEKIDTYALYEEFRLNGWSHTLASQTRKILLPEITRAVALAWLSAIIDVRNEKPLPKINKI